ncbi:hypothetical protein OKW45_002694 [Paraburkholderia sp. WSM4175]
MQHFVRDTSVESLLLLQIFDCPLQRMWLTELESIFAE